MSLLTVLLVVVAFLVAAALITAADNWIRPKLNYPPWIVHFAYGLLALVVILYVCKELGVWQLLSSVRT